MDTISQLPGLLEDMQKSSGPKFLEALVRFTQTINSMTDNQLVAFYQGLDFFQESQPKGNIFNRTPQYKMIQKIKNVAKSTMKDRIDACWGGQGRSALISTFKKAVPAISY